MGRKQMSFKTLAITTAIIAFLLGLGYLFFGAIIVGRWQIEPTGSVLLLGRRLAALYIGLSVIFFLARSAPVSTVRTGLSIGAAIALSFLALLGIYELLSGHVGRGIVASIAVEALLAICYIWILLTERKNKSA
jgi:hypothetical protein